MKKDCHAEGCAALDERGARHRRRSGEQRRDLREGENLCVHLASGSPEGNTTPNSPITRTFAPESPAHARGRARGLLTGRASIVVCSYAGDEHFSMSIIVQYCKPETALRHCSTCPA